MIMLDKLKLSCYKCLVGHRSSYCDHINERILYELKPNGRPKRKTKVNIEQFRFGDKIIVGTTPPNADKSLIIKALSHPLHCSTCTSCINKSCCVNGIKCECCLPRCPCGCSITGSLCSNCFLDLCPKCPNCFLTPRI